MGIDKTKGDLKMHKLISFVILALIVFGATACGSNPTGPAVSNIPEPTPVATPDPYKNMSFDDLTNSLNTPDKIESWIKKNRPYVVGKNAGWGNIGSDRAHSLAIALYDESGAVCGNFAGFFVYCMRKAGYECGGLNYLNMNNMIAHTGAYYIVDDKVKCFSLPKLGFDSKQDLIDFFDNNYNDNGRDVWGILDNTMNVINKSDFLGN